MTVARRRVKAGNWFGTRETLLKVEAWQTARHGCQLHLHRSIAQMHACCILERDEIRSVTFREARVSKFLTNFFFSLLFSNSFECVYSRLEPRESIIIGRENRILAWEEGGIESFAIGGGEGGNWESREGCGGEGEFFFSLVNNEFRGNSFCFFLVFGTGELEREEFLFPVQGW